MTDEQNGGTEGDSSESVILGDNDTEDRFGMNVEFSYLPEEALSDGFNRFGIRENDDGSLDVRFNAMEPGVRRGVEVTEEFLQSVSDYDYSRIPLQLDHSMSQRANVGYIDPERIKFSDEFLQLQAHIPNTGSSVRNDIISDFTHEPPQVKDISVSFDPRTVEIEKPAKRGGTPKFMDARIREFSLTPFPAGYDNGGLTPEFSAAVEKAKISTDSFSEPESKLVTRPHILIQK